jgi:hypothetical protein
MKTIQRIWQKITPNFLLVFVRFILAPEDYKNKRQAVLTHFKKIDKRTLPPEIREGLKYLRYRKFSSFPYKWTLKYDNLLPTVMRDEVNQHFYILFDSKKMYFPKRFTEDHVIWAGRSMLKEQDPHSPHLYLTGDFQPEEGSIIIDAGVAEGNFALSVVEKARRLYLVECDPEWMKALRLTFEPWKEKVVFIEKFMSDTAGDTTTSVDDLLDPIEDGPYFVKLDIEGYEQKALAGMKKLIVSGKPVRMNVCTYHNPNDFKEIKSTLESSGFVCHVTEGYVLFFHQGEKPEFRRVLIRAEKNS